MSLSKQNLCLIGGTGRSGTTILKQVFSRHPDMASISGRELRFPIDPDGLVDFCRTFETGWSPFLWDVKVKRLERMLRQVSRNNPVLNVYSYLVKKYLQAHVPFSLTARYSGLNGSRFSPQLDQLISEFIAELSEYRYPAYWVGSGLFEPGEMGMSGKSLEQVYQCTGDFWVRVIDDICRHQGGKGSFVEDNTFIILFFDTVLKLIENARLVHIYRDPRDVVASYVGMSWAPGDAEKAAHWYKRVINEWFAVRARLPESSFIEIGLESLIDDPQGKLRSVCEFWGIDWNDCLLETRLSGSSTGRWRKDFSDHDQTRINEILDDEIRLLGYS